MRINIFKNQFKEKETDKDWWGKTEIEKPDPSGKTIVYKTAGWNNKTKDGNDTYIGLIIERELVDPEVEIKENKEEAEIPF